MDSQTPPIFKRPSIFCHLYHPPKCPDHTHTHTHTTVQNTLTPFKSSLISHIIVHSPVKTYKHTQTPHSTHTSTEHLGVHTPHTPIPCAHTTFNSATAQKNLPAAPHSSTHAHTHTPHTPMHTLSPRQAQTNIYTYLNINYTHTYAPYTNTPHA